MTESERLFEIFARQTKLQLFRIPTAHEIGERRPDYVVRMMRRRARKVCVEIKEFVPNEAEDTAIAALEKTGVSSMPSVVPGARVRIAIASARPQLKALSKGRWPSLLLIYDRVLGRNLHTDPYSILTAMRGLDVVPVFVPSDPTLRPIFGNARPGPKKCMTANQNTSISAIALLRHYGTKALAIHIYHNPHAAIPLRLQDMPSHSAHHYVMNPDESDWRLINAAQVQMMPSRHS